MASFAVMQEILEALADPIVIVDGKREIIAANAAAREIFPIDLMGRNIANRHRGRFTIESRQGEGSVFTVVLPSAPPEKG